MDHHLVLILAEVLNRITDQNSNQKVRIVNFLGNSYSNMPPEKGKLDASVAIVVSLS